MREECVESRGQPGKEEEEERTTFPPDGRILFYLRANFSSTFDAETHQPA